MSSVVISGDTSGAVTISAPAVAGTTTLTLPAISGTILQSGTTVTEAQGGTGTTTGYYGFKNRLINSAMVIDQRNAGASVTINTAAQTYTVDRWRAYGVTSAGVYTVQQNNGAVTPPSGFAKYLGAKTTTADSSVAAGSYYFLSQLIEGFNTSDLDFGTANAKTVTLSFWVYSSLTGTFGGSLSNSAFNRSYPFTYTISSANTWEQKSITIAGDTSGTWIGATNGIGIAVYFDLGSGSSNVGTTGAWAGAGYVGATGDTKVIGTLNATFYITGVQLEKGSTATSFDYRPYGTELALCQRYYESSYDIGTAAASATTTGLRLWSWAINGSNGGNGFVIFQVPKRTAPTVAIYDGAGNVNKVSYSSAAATPTYTNNISQQAGPYNITTNGFIHAGQGVIGNVYNYAHFTASSEL